MSFVDIAGIVRGASEGQGLGNAFLANIREADAICQVIRAFADPDVVHVDGEVSPEGRHRDDQHRADPRRPADPREGAAAAGEGGEAPARTAAASLAAAAAGAASCSTAGTTLFAGAGRAASTSSALRELHLLTAKPFLYVFNVDEDGAGRRGAARPSCARWSPRPRRSSWTPRSSPSWSSCPTTRRASCCSRSGQDGAGPATSSPGSASRTLGPADLPDRRARRRPGPGRSASGATAPEAAGVIHTDFQRGFIKAEVVSFDDLVAAGSMAEAKAARQGPHRGQGLRHARRRRGGVPLQRVNRRVCAGQRGCGASQSAQSPQEISAGWARSGCFGGPISGLGAAKRGPARRDSSPRVSSFDRGFTKRDWDRLATAQRRVVCWRALITPSR